MLEIIFHSIFMMILVAIPYMGSDPMEIKFLREKIKNHGRKSLTKYERNLAVKYGIIR